MAHVVVMPKLGNTVESCIIVGWKVSEGQEVQPDSVLCEIETDKATMDVPAGVSGTVLKILKREGDDVPVLEPIAVVGAAGETFETLAPAASADSASADSAGAKATKTLGDTVEASPVAPAETAAGAGPEARLASQASLASHASMASHVGMASPRAKKIAAEKALPLSAIQSGTGPGGRIIERDVRAALEARPGLTASARDLATLRGIYEAGKTGTGLGGRLTRADVASGHTADQYTDTPIKSIRKIISDRMMHSLQTSAQITLNTTAPADHLLAIRNRFKNSDPALGLAGITIGDLVAYAAVRVLAAHPKINAHVLDNVMRSYSSVHLGLAVDTPRGLMVPVLRDAGALSLREFSERSKILAKSCISGSADPDTLSGSTFTVTNLGAFGIESFTPILNEPETAILGVNAIIPRPSLDKQGIASVEMRIGFSLTTDHRVVDGADGARYLKDLCDFIANIDIAMIA